MMFVQSLRGLSHTKLEDTKEEHLELAVRAPDRLADKALAWVEARSVTLVPKNRRVAIAAGVAFAFATGWNLANVGAVAEQLADAYGVALVVVGLFTTALFVVHGAMLIPGGMAADRFGARRSGLAAAAFVALGNSLLLLAPSAGLALAGRAFVGFGTGLAFIAGSDYVRAHGGSPLAQGLYGGAAVAGGGAALAAVPLVEETVAWRAPYVTALVLALAALVALLLAPPAPRTPRPRVRARVMRDRRLYPLALMQAASFGLSVVVGNWVVTLLTRGGAAEDVAGAVGALTLAAGIVTRPLGGWIARARPALTRTAVAASLVACALGTLVLAARGPLVVSAIAAAVVGLAAGIPFAPAVAAAQAARPDAPGAAVGLINAAAVGAIVAATPLVGLTFSLRGDGAVGFVAVAALWAASALATPRFVTRD